MSAVPDSFTLNAGDGYPLSARHWPAAGAASAVVVINPATAVRADYYHRYARFLSGQGFAVLTYDYRGIGESRQGNLRRWRQFGKFDWGRLDCEAALAWASRQYPDWPLHVVAHSIGGVLVGLAPSAARVQRIYSVGSQYAYWPDYGAGKAGMWLRWHLLMPLLTAIFGYFPARRLGWHEDLPARAACEWAFRPARIEDSYPGQRDAVLASFAAVQADILAVGLSDDAFGTPAALRRLLAYYRNSCRQHVVIAPADLGLPAIGHFAWFHERFRDTLWQESLVWLRDGVNRRPPALLLPPGLASDAAIGDQVELGRFAA